MKKVSLALLACLSVPSAGLAADWSLRSTLSQTVELNDNQFLRTMLAGGSLGSYTTVSANAAARTPTSLFTLDGSVNYQKYWGPGTDGIPQTESLSNSISAHYETFGKESADRNYLDVNWQRQPTAFALLRDFGVLTSATGDIDTTTLSGGIDRWVTASDFATVSVRSSLTSFDPPGGGTPFTDSSVKGTWRHKLSGTTSLIASSEFEWLSFQSNPKSNLMIVREMGGIDSELSPLLTFHGAAGVAYLRSQGGGSAVLPGQSLGTSTSSPSGDTSGFLMDLLLTYRVLKSTTLTLAADQTIGPTFIGALNQQSTLRAGIIQEINSRSTLSLAADATRQIAAGSADFFSGSATFSYVLARDWQAQFSYRYLHRNGTSGFGGSPFIDPITRIPISTPSGNGPASSNSFLVVVSRIFTILPPGK